MDKEAILLEIKIIIAPRRLRRDVAECNGRTTLGRRTLDLTLCELSVRTNRRDTHLTYSWLLYRLEQIKILSYDDTDLEPTLYRRVDTYPTSNEYLVPTDASRYAYAASRCVRDTRHTQIGVRSPRLPNVVHAKCFSSYCLLSCRSFFHISFNGKVFI